MPDSLVIFAGSLIRQPGSAGCQPCRLSTGPDTPLMLHRQAAIDQPPPTQITANRITTDTRPAQCNVDPPPIDSQPINHSLVRLLRGDLRLGGWVGQREDEGACRVLAQLLNHVLGPGGARGCRGGNTGTKNSKDRFCWGSQAPAGTAPQPCPGARRGPRLHNRRQQGGRRARRHEGHRSWPADCELSRLILRARGGHKDTQHWTVRTGSPDRPIRACGFTWAMMSFRSCAARGG